LDKGLGKIRARKVQCLQSHIEPCLKELFCVR
jgi:hypothetical protein